MNVYTTVLNAGSGGKEGNMEGTDLQKAHSRGKIGRSLVPIKSETRDQEGVH